MNSLMIWFPDASYIKEFKLSWIQTLSWNPGNKISLNVCIITSVSSGQRHFCF